MDRLRLVSKLALHMHVLLASVPNNKKSALLGYYLGLARSMLGVHALKRGAFARVGGTKF